MQVFLSAGEPSGDLHAANLVSELRKREPNIQCFGFGGPHLAAAGADVLYPLASHAIMGLSGIVRALPTMFRLVRQAAAEVERRKPIAAVLIDYPGFHWHLAKRIRRSGVPVISFVPPQIWAWASHRVRKMRRCFDRVLCSLPFEPEWYRQRGIDAEYVGHPYFDELTRRTPGVSRGVFTAPGPIIAVLPGSRRGELDRNLDMQVRAVRLIHGRRPDASFHFVCFKEAHRSMVVRALDELDAAAHVHVGQMPEVLSSADAAIAVSGSVGLELLHHAVPSVIVYRVNPLYRAIARKVLNVPHISLVNLLAGHELFPEFLTSGDESSRIAERILEWLNAPTMANRLRTDLIELRSRVGHPGACAAAANCILGCSRRQVAA
jgi:lipid-A-disaccharide synthase